MAATRITNNQIATSTITAQNIQSGTLTGALFSPTLTLNSNVSITGNLSVSGNMATVNAVNTYITDPLVIFNQGYAGSLSNYDVGFIVDRSLRTLSPYGAVNTVWAWVENDSAFEALTTTTTGNALTTVTSAGFANLKAGNTTLVSATITGALNVSGNTTLGTISVSSLQGVIGNVTPQAANFTTANATTANATTINATTINGATVGNVGASVLGTYGNIGTVNATNVYALNLGNVSTAILGANIFTTGNITGTGLFSNVGATSLSIYGNAFVSNTGKINFGTISNVQITGGTSGQYIQTDGAGNLTFTTLNIIGNAISLGSNTQGALVSNAVTLTTSTTVTDSVALINAILGKLVPPSPPNFPATSLTQTTGTVSGLMTNFVQTDNSGWGNLSVSGGTAVNVIRSAVFATSTVSNSGTTASGGNIQLYINGNVYPNNYHALSSTPSSADNGTYGNLIVSGVQDYHNIVSTVNAGFWNVFSAQISASSIPAGWNRANIYYTGDAAGTSTLTWYYDSSAPSAPAFSATSMTFSSNTVTYSPSTIPHLNASAGFTLRGTVQNISGDIYPNSTNLFSTTTAAAPFTAPAQVSYATAGVTTPITRNNTTPISFTTTSNISGTFGSTPTTTGPTVSVSNGYTPTTSAAFASGNIVLYKTTSTGSTTVIDETSIFFNSAVGGSTTPAALRVNNPDAGTATDTPSFSSPGSVFNTLYVTDVTNPGNAYNNGPGLKWDNTNYSTGYLPVGPNLSTRGGGAQYFTFKFVRTSTSKFNLTFTTVGSTTGIAGMWVAMPGYGSISGYNAGNVNGWLDMTKDYSVSGGASLGGVLTANGSNTTYSLNASFGTASSTNATNNEIWVRIKLASGQVLSALYLGASTA